jgi:hypothetical protein
MSETKPTEQTTVQQVDINIDDIFGGAPGADSIVLPAAEDKKPSFFSTPKTDLTFLDKEDEEDEDGNPKPSTQTANDLLNELTNDVNDLQDQDDDAPKGGRPKVDKSGMVETFSKLIEEGLLIGFEDDKPMDEYSIKDWKELLQANFEEKERAIKEQTPKEFFEALPEELQYAAQYVANGGNDLKGLFSALAQVEEVRGLDPTDEMDQEQIVRSYLRATGFGNDEDIDEEIVTWKDLGKLEQQANKFKPKLDRMQESIVAQKIAEQEQMKAQQEQAASAYMDNVYEALKPSELAGIKLDKKTQAMLYAGLVQPNYPSISGRNTNLLGHLLEKHQFVEPNYPLVAEALWLLADPEGYKSKIMDQGKNKVVENTVRQLKTEQNRKISSTVPDDKDDEPKQRKIPRQTNIFKRF